MKVKVTQLHPTLCDPMDYTVNGILQAKILECVAYPFSRGSLQPRDRTQVSWIAGKFFTNWAIREIWVWICSNSCPLSQWWWHAPISSSVTPFSSCPQYFPASGSCLMSQVFASGGQSIRASFSVSVLPMNIQGWFPLGLTSLISLQSKGLSRVFSSTTIPWHQYFGAQPSLWSSSHIHTWLLGKS